MPIIVVDPQEDTIDLVMPQQFQLESLIPRQRVRFTEREDSYVDYQGLVAVELTVNDPNDPCPIRICVSSEKLQHDDAYCHALQALVGIRIVGLLRVMARERNFHSFEASEAELQHIRHELARDSVAV